MGQTVIYSLLQHLIFKCMRIGKFYLQNGGYTERTQEKTPYFVISILRILEGLKSFIFFAFRLNSFTISSVIEYLKL